MKLSKLPLLAKVVIGILLGVLFSIFLPEWCVRIFVTLSGIFSNFLGFIIPLLIVGLVAPGIAELGKGAGKLLGITSAIAYGSTVFAGFLSYYSCVWTYPSIIDRTPEAMAKFEGLASSSIAPYFSIDMPPVMSVMTALILAFVLGLGLSKVEGGVFRGVLNELKEVIELVIRKVIIPILPFYIFCIFLKIGAEGSVVAVLGLFLKVILVIFVIHVLLLLIQFSVAGAIAGKNPFKALLTMLPAYMTALGTQSSAATIPVTLAQAKKNGVTDEVAEFSIPLCATIHLSGSTLKIVACAFAISYMLGMPTNVGLYAGFIMMLGITMVAAPGVPGGAIMAALGVLTSILGFDENMIGLMIALYIAMDSFGTACNVTGDGAIALVVDKIYKKR